MRNKPRLLAWACYAVLVCVVVSADNAQAQTVCIPPSQADSLDLYLVDKVSAYTEPIDASYEESRVALKLPVVARTQLQVITQETTCKRLRDAYAAKVAGVGSGLSGRVLALKVGTVYVVLDPSYRDNPSFGGYTHMVIDSKYNVLTVFQ